MHYMYSVQQLKSDYWH